MKDGTPLTLLGRFCQKQLEDKTLLLEIHTCEYDVALLNRYENLGVLEDFPSLMKQKRENLNLAYGLKSKGFHYLVSLKGSFVLCSAILKEVDDATVILH